MIFTTPQKKAIQKIILKLYKDEIKKVHKTKYLGVVLDNRLKWKSRIGSLNKSFRGIGILFNINHFTSRYMLRNCFFTFFQFHLNYNILDWICAHFSNLKRTLALFNKAVKIPCSNSFENFRKYSIGRFMCKLCHN